MRERNAACRERRKSGVRLTGRRPRRTVQSILPYKTCPRCRETLPLEAFVINRSKSTEVGGYCLGCHNHVVRTNVEKNHGSTRNYHLKRRYRLTDKDVAAMVEAQGGKCAICRTDPAEHVDHDHETGDVRGILCFTCNVGLGNFKDDVERLVLAQRYLARPTAEERAYVRARLDEVMRRAS